MIPGQTFSQRIQARTTLWWGGLPPGHELPIRRAARHRLREHYALRHRDDPDETWRCCPLWQRTLINKWNSREFVIRHGGAVPELYWCARAPSRARLAALPSHFVIRPLWGTSRWGVYVVAEGRDLLRNKSASPAELRRGILAAHRVPWIHPVLAEEFVRSDDGEYRLPTEYKCHTFRDTVAAVQVTERVGPREGVQRFYTPDWAPYSDRMNVSYPHAPVRDPPRDLDAMVHLALRLGAALGTYMRVDFFSTERGWVFNEFSSTPECGRNFTPFCDELFGALWDETFPSAS